MLVPSEVNDIFSDDEEDDDEAAALRRFKDLKVDLEERSDELLQATVSTKHPIQALKDYLRGPEFREYKDIQNEHRDHISTIASDLLSAIGRVRDGIDSLEAKRIQTAGILSSITLAMTSANEKIGDQYTAIKKQIEKPNRTVSKTWRTLLECAEAMSEDQEELLVQHAHLEKVLNKLSIEQLSIEQDSSQ